MIMQIVHRAGYLVAGVGGAPSLGWASLNPKGRAPLANFYRGPGPLTSECICTAPPFQRGAPFFNSHKVPKELGS